MEKMIVMKIKDIRYHVVLLLFLISLISSIMLSVTPVSVICDVSSGCEVVHYSQYNYTFGMQNSYYGVIIFALLIILTLSYLINPTQNKKAMINLSIVIGSLIALYFLSIQHFILEAYCRYCLIVDFSMMISLILIFPELKKGFFGFKNEENIAEGS